MPDAADQDRTQCTPCRGTGQVLSNLGGEHAVTCPWCAGTGRFDPGRDAQAPATGGTSDAGASPA